MWSPPSSHSASPPSSLWSSTAASSSPTFGTFSGDLATAQWFSNPRVTLFAVFILTSRGAFFVTVFGDVLLISSGHFFVVVRIENERLKGTVVLGGFAHGSHRFFGRRLGRGDGALLGGRLFNGGGGGRPRLGRCWHLARRCGRLLRWTAGFCHAVVGGSYDRRPVGGFVLRGPIAAISELCPRPTTACRIFARGHVFVVHSLRDGYI
ncbi:hypothetical protein MTO96_047072 [Rhipicephalus appendiculatus]